jgi:3',5'-cyclic AMP phosphodiesterase CpdA
MLIAQLTDLHLGFETGNPDELNARRLNIALDWLGNLAVRPDMLFLSGDLADRGEIESYERLRDKIRALAFPVYLCVGNHDDRAALRHAFPHLPNVNGFVQYVVDRPEVRFIVLDTVDDGLHGGAFCSSRATWLREQLDAVPGKPVMIVLHHPPIETGIPWMTSGPMEPWVIALDAVIGDRPGVTLICGHIHRSITTNWRGRMLAISPSTAPQVALEMAPIDAERPDGRRMIVAEAPGAALHLWTGETFVTHHVSIGDYPVLARFDDKLQPLVRSLRDEYDAPYVQARAAHG